jgi:CRISPR system Cascade subunit CasE
MIASMLTLDWKSIRTLGIRDNYAVHKFVYSLFPGSQREFLYLDQGGYRGGRRILIISRKQPLVPPIGTLRMKSIPEGFLEHSAYAFQVRVNPVERKNGNSRLIPIVSRPELLDWFTKKQEMWGFSVASEHLEIMNIGIQTIQKKDMTIIHNSVEYRGILHVTDQERFKYFFENGVGRGKGYGFGLMQLRPISNI